MASPDEWFNETLNAFKNRTLPRYIVFDLGLSPNLGLKHLARAKIMMPQAVVTKMVEKHRIDLELLRNLPSLVRNPLKLYRSKSDPSTTLFLLDLQSQGESLVMAAQYCRHRDFGMVYLVKSIHHRPLHQLTLWEDESLLVYKKETKPPQDSAPCN